MSPVRRKVRRVWSAIRGRCGNPKNRAFHYYGGRGISVCDRWNKFSKFLEDVGDPPGLGRRWSLDRIDNDGNYEPGNVRWATQTEQNDNRRMCIRIEIDGVCRTAHGWVRAGIAKVRACTITERIYDGMDPVAAVLTQNRTGIGEAQHSSKLTTEKIRELRGLHQTGESKGALARRYGVARSTVRRIVNREIWKQVA